MVSFFKALFDNLFVRNIVKTSVSLVTNTLYANIMKNFKIPFYLLEVYLRGILLK